MNVDFTKKPGRIAGRELYPDFDKPLVSVITPFYNAGKYFAETFNSVINQTFPWFEWIIVNDGSTQKEDIELLHRLAETDRRVSIITQENGGLSCARNTGIANSNTELIAPLDADDLIAPTYLECLYWGLYYNADAAWAYTSSYGFHDQEYVWQYPFNAERLKTYNFLNYAAMIRKKDALEIGGYKVEKWSYYEDWRFWLEMLGKSKYPVHIASCLFWYRRLESGMLSTINKDPERVKFCQNIIENAAQNADGQVEAVEYPFKMSKESFYIPEYKEWTMRAYREHERIRVLWLIPWMMMGGADKFNLDAISGLKENNIDSFILTTQAGSNEWRQKFEDYTDEIFCMPDFLDPVHYIEFVSYFIQTREIDVLMVTDSYDGYYMLPWLRKHFPDLVIMDYVHMEEWYWRKGGYARTSAALGWVLEKTFVCNSSTRNVLVEQFGRKEETVDVLYIGVDQHYFNRNLVKEGFLHQKLKLEAKQKIILFPCRIHPQKRPFFMLDIAWRVHQQIPEIVFVVAGDGGQLQELRQEVAARKMDTFVFCIGQIDDMRACYRDSVLTLICSLKEGLSLTAYESLSMGVPVVSSDVGGQRDLIGEDVGALIPLRQKEWEDFDKREFDQEERDEYVEQIVRILKDPILYQKLSDNCRDKIEKMFSIDKMVQKLSEEIYFLRNDGESEIKRKELSEKMQQFCSFPDDYYTMYHMWRRKDEECEEVWRERCWFEALWKEGKVKRLIYIAKERMGIHLAGCIDKIKKIFS